MLINDIDNDLSKDNEPVFYDSRVSLLLYINSLVLLLSTAEIGLQRNIDKNVE